MLGCEDTHSAKTLVVAAELLRLTVTGASPIPRNRSSCHLCPVGAFNVSTEKCGFRGVRWSRFVSRFVIQAVHDKCGIRLGGILGSIREGSTSGFGYTRRVATLLRETIFAARSGDLSVEIDKDSHDAIDKAINIAIELATPATRLL